MTRFLDNSKHENICINFSYHSCKHNPLLHCVSVCLLCSKRPRWCQNMAKYTAYGTFMPKMWMRDVKMQHWSCVFSHVLSVVQTVFTKAPLHCDGNILSIWTDNMCSLIFEKKMANQKFGKKKMGNVECDCIIGVVWEVWMCSSLHSLVSLWLPVYLEMTVSIFSSTYLDHNDFLRKMIDLLFLEWSWHLEVSWRHIYFWQASSGHHKVTSTYEDVVVATCFNHNALLYHQCNPSFSYSTF